MSERVSRHFISPAKWIKPQLTRLVDEAPTGAGWLHEIKYDGYS
jgi:ATP-dependent DNA ligase